MIENRYIARCDSCNEILEGLDGETIWFPEMETLLTIGEAYGWSMEELYTICPNCLKNKQEG